MTTEKRQLRDEFLNGALIALGEVYAVDEESVAESIVKLIGPYALLRIAQNNEDAFLPNLRHTIRYLNEQKKVRA